VTDTSPDFNTPASFLSLPGQPGLPVLVGEEHAHPPVVPLGDMVRHSVNHCARYSRHARFFIRTVSLMSRDKSRETMKQASKSDKIGMRIDLAARGPRRDVS
jgi:hypothetical protein